MRIAVLSTYNWIRQAANYGSVLQYYALQKHLEAQGHSVYWIRYVRPQQQPRLIDKLGKLLDPQAVARRIRKALDPSRARRVDTMAPLLRFQPFLDRHIHTSEHEYRSLEELRQHPPEADVYIVGSDQVWRGTDPINYLDFGGPDVKRLSYAASSMWEILTDEWKRNAAPLVRKLDHVSVREHAGRDICAQMGRLDVEVVVDPTLLLPREAYLSLLRSSSSSNWEDSASAFALAYMVNDHSPEEFGWQQFVEFANSENLAIKCVPVQGAEQRIPRRYHLDPSLEEWIGAFAHAQVVLTNSFHGTVFSILMQRPFLSVLQNGVNGRENVRFRSLLGSLGLEDRVFDPSANPGVENLREAMRKPIDWNAVEFRLQVWREKSFGFLRASGLQT